MNLLSIVAIHFYRRDAPGPPLKEKPYSYAPGCVSGLVSVKILLGDVALATLGLSPATFSKVPPSLLCGGRHLASACIGER